MQYYHDELMNQMVSYRQQRVAELVAASQRGTGPGNAIRKHLGLSLIWLGEKLRQDDRSYSPQMASDGRLRTRSSLT
jgi:hypothetical protein